jgi:hypothetical protein
VHAIGRCLVSDVSLVAAERRACGFLVYGIDPRIDLSSRVSTNHVVEYQLAAWVSVFPGIAHSEYVVLEDNDRLTGGDEVLDLAPGVYAGGGHYGGDYQRSGFCNCATR